MSNYAKKLAEELMKEWEIGETIRFGGFEIANPGAVAELISRRESEAISELTSGLELAVANLKSVKKFGLGFGDVIPRLDALIAKHAKK